MKTKRLTQLLALGVATLLLTQFSGCETEALEVPYEDKAVVEAYLHPGLPVQVRISREVPYEEGAPQSADSLQQLDVTLSAEGQTFPLVYHPDGYYTCIDSAFQITAGITYTLQFGFNGKQVKATAAIPGKPSEFQISATTVTLEGFTPGTGGPPTFPEPIELAWANSDAAYHLVVTENIEADPEPVFSDTTVNIPFRVFRNEPTTASEYSIRTMQLNYYGTYRLVLFRLNPEYAALYRQAGTNSQNLTTPASNIENGLGIFTGINSDTLFLEAIE